MIAYADGLDTPRSSPELIAKIARLDSTEVFLGWTPEHRPWLASPLLTGRTVLAGYALADAVADGRLRYLPVRLSSVPRLVADALRPDVAVVTGVRRGAELVFGVSVGWGPAVARAARGGVVVEVDPDGADLGGPPIPGHVIDAVDRPGLDFPPPVPRPPDDIDMVIGRHVTSVLPEEPTLQHGPGGIAEAIMAAIDRPVRIWSGVVTDAVAALDERGLLLGSVTTAYVWGGKAVGQLAAAGRLRLVPVEETHDLTRVSAIERFVACNTALQVGIEGSVNVERVGGRYVAGIGGHADFCAAAARSVGGIAVIALRSTTRAGASTIVGEVEVVSTPRCDVEVIVTEHGVADIRGVDDAERARRIAAIAAPQYRASLLP